MKTAALVLAGVLCTAPLMTSALAQAGSATSGSVGGQNTIQQAPSGGATAVGGRGGATTAPQGTAARGEPTPEERQTEKHNNDVTQICKGC